VAAADNQRPPLGFNQGGFVMGTKDKATQESSAVEAVDVREQEADAAVVPMEAEPLEERETEDTEEVDRIKQDQILKEIECGYRVVEDSPLGKIRVYRDTVSFVRDDGDSAYTRERYRLLKDPDVPTHKELMDLYVARGIWSRDDDKQIVSLVEEIGEIEKARDDKGELTADQALKLAEKYESFWRLIGTKEDLFSDTVEAKARNAKFLAMVVAAVRVNPEDDKEVPGRKLDQPIKSVDVLRDFPEKDFKWVTDFCRRFWGEMSSAEAEGFFGQSLDEPTSN